MANIDMRLPESDTSLLAGMIGKALGEFVYGERFVNVTPYMSACPSFVEAIVSEPDGPKVMFEFESWFSGDIGAERGLRGNRKLLETIEGTPEETRKWCRVSREVVSPWERG